MKGRALWAVLLLMAPALLALPSSTALITGHDLCIISVNPGPPGEFLELINTGASQISLHGYSVTDGEGTITFGSQALAPFSSMILAQNRTLIERMMPDGIILGYDDVDLRAQGRFALANDGDQLSLMHEGEVADCVCYGDIEPPEGWAGGPCRKPEVGHLLMKKDPGTPITASTSWMESSAGRTIFPPLTCAAEVIPLVFPDAGHAPIVDLIDNATSSMVISVYTLDDEEIVSSLLGAVRRGISVDILLEGQPVGGMTERQKTTAATLSAKGCSVHLMAGTNSFRRYEFIHAKYAVFDNSTLLITSENWGQGLHHNRGWGAVVRSQEMAGRMMAVFQNDSDERWNDLIRPTGQPSDIGHCSWGPSQYDNTWTTAEVTILVSPCASIDQVLGLVRSSQERLLIEQMSFDDGWGSETGMIPAIVQSGARGAETKVLLDGTSSDLQNRITINAMLGSVPVNVEARLETAFHSFTMVHNKGIISDDSVLVSSINFGHNAFSENREVGIIIRSPEVADTFTSVFRLDWLPDPDPPRILLRFDNITVDGTDSMAIDASGSWDESGVKEVLWDLDRDGVFELAAKRAIISLESRATQVFVRVTDNYGNVAELPIDIPSWGPANDDGISITPWAGTIPLALLALFFLRKRIK